MTFRDQPGLWGQKWHALSANAHYAIRVEGDSFVALFIPGVFATAEKIGRAQKTRDGAERLCERHALAPNITSLAKGI